MAATMQIEILDSDAAQFRSWLQKFQNNVFPQSSHAILLSETSVTTKKYARLRNTVNKISRSLRSKHV
jgi:hypothetical protein